MATNIPLLLNLANDLNRLSLTATPFYESPLHCIRHSPYLALLNADQPPQHVAQPLSQSRYKQFAGMSTIGKDGFQVCMDVHEFKPSELDVKVVYNCVVVEGKHDEREDDHGFITRNFVRRYTLPKGYDPDKVVSSLSSDGFLTIHAPKPQIEDKTPNERHIQIQQVGPVHLNVKENPKDEIEGDKEQPTLAA